MHRIIADCMQPRLGSLSSANYSTPNQQKPIWQIIPDFLFHKNIFSIFLQNFTFAGIFLAGIERARVRIDDDDAKTDLDQRTDLL